MSLEKANNLIELLQKGDVKIGENEFNNHNSKNIMTQRLNFNLDDFNRIICKIAFNIFAKYNKDIVFYPEYDLLRKYIRFGENDKKIEFCYCHDNAKKYIDNIKKQLKLLEKSHYIYIANNPDYKDMLGLVCLYDNHGFAIKTGENCYSKKEVFYINNIEERKEFNLFKLNNYA